MGRTFQRENFAVLEFLGQFNLAFLVARLHRHSLFIIDQHAADEKSNYEKFCDSLKLQTQLLLAPVPLELSPSDLALAREEISALQACGFGVQDDGTRLLLTGFPISGSTELGIADFNELLALLAERSALSTPSGALPRPRRVTSMLMSRACRRAVMIGDPLEAEVCRRILRGLASLRHPWQCPHGRPTINFLADLENIPKCTYSRRPPT
jgi:DNA mismatch repair protein PMS2